MLVQIDNSLAIDTKNIKKIEKKYKTVGDTVIPYTQIVSRVEYEEELVFTNTPFEEVVTLVILTQEKENATRT